MSEEKDLKTVRCHNSKTGVTYLYSYEYYFDEKQKKWRQHRHLIGKIDETGKTIPTLSRGRPPRSAAKERVKQDASAENSDLVNTLQMRLEALEKEVKDLRKENSELFNQRKRMIQAIEKAISL